MIDVQRLQTYAKMVEECNHKKIADDGDRYGNGDTEIEVETMFEKHGQCYEKYKRREDKPEDTHCKRADFGYISGFNIEPDHPQYRDQRDGSENCAKQCAAFGYLRYEHNESGGNGDFSQIKCHLFYPFGVKKYIHCH